MTFANSVELRFGLGLAIIWQTCPEPCRIATSSLVFALYSAIKGQSSARSGCVIQADSFCSLALLTATCIKLWLEQLQTTQPPTAFFGVQAVFILCSVISTTPWIVPTTGSTHGSKDTTPWFQVGGRHCLTNSTPQDSFNLGSARLSTNRNGVQGSHFTSGESKGTAMPLRWREICAAQSESHCRAWLTLML